MRVIVSGLGLAFWADARRTEESAPSAANRVWVADGAIQPFATPYRHRYGPFGMTSLGPGSSGHGAPGLRGRRTCNTVLVGWIRGPRRRCDTSDAGTAGVADFGCAACPFDNPTGHGVEQR
jgi:hypothetical protein